MSSPNVELTGNTVQPKRQGPGMKTAFSLGPGCENQTVRVSGNKGF